MGTVIHNILEMNRKLCNGLGARTQYFKFITHPSIELSKISKKMEANEPEKSVREPKTNLMWRVFDEFACTLNTKNEYIVEST